MQLQRAGTPPELPCLQPNPPVLIRGPLLPGPPGVVLQILQLTTARNTTSVGCIAAMFCRENRTEVSVGMHRALCRPCVQRVLHRMHPAQSPTWDASTRSATHSGSTYSRSHRRIGFIAYQFPTTPLIVSTSALFVSPHNLFHYPPNSPLILRSSTLYRSRPRPCTLSRLT